MKGRQKGCHLGNARAWMFFSAFLLWTACCCPRVAARSIYVDGKFTGTSTGAQSAPYPTIGQATAVSAPGDTIFVGDGVYKETVVPKSGTPGNYVTYRAAHRWAAHVVGVQDNGCFSLCGTGNGSRFDANVPGQRYVAIDGFDLDNPNNDGYAYGVKVNQASHIRITSCRIHGCGCNGIGTCYSDYLDVEHNVVYDNATNSVLGPSGISLWRTSPSDQAPGFHNVISGNLVYDNRETGSNHTDGNGIIIDSTSQDRGTVVENNVVFNNGGAGIALDGSANCTVRFNTLYEDSTDRVTHYAEVRLDTVTWESGTPYNTPCSDCAVYGNVLYAQPGRNALEITAASVHCRADHNLRFGTASGDTVGPGDVTAEPLFVRPNVYPEYADFHLQQTSPAIRAAGPAEETLRGTDYDEKIRSDPTSLGAYQCPLLHRQPLTPHPSPRDKPRHKSASTPPARGIVFNRPAWISLANGMTKPTPSRSPSALPQSERLMLPRFERVVIDARTENSSHKPKVFDRFSKDGVEDIGSVDRDGFKLYRATQGWRPYVIFPLDKPGDYEDAVTADVNGDGWKDIVLGGWGNRTIWAENPAGRGKDPYTTPWTVHVVDTTRFSHEVCAAVLNRGGKTDVVTTSGIYFQGATPDDWKFVDIGRGGQGTQVANMLGNGDGYQDVIAVYQAGGKNQIAWFENPGHTGGSAVTGHWQVHLVDVDPGGRTGSNKDMDEMAFAVGDINGDGRPDVVAAGMGEGPDKSNDPRQIGDGLVWYEAPSDPRTGGWAKHVIDATAGWVHASSMQLADFDGDGFLDVCYAEQDQSGPTAGNGPGRGDGVSSPRLAICYRTRRDGSAWRTQVLSQYPEVGAGGFNSKVGMIGHDKGPSIVTSLHGFYSSANPLLLWRNVGGASEGFGQDADRGGQVREAVRGT